MRLRVNFGLNESKEVDWFLPLSQFPHVIKFKGINWEWFMYSNSPKDGADTTLVFSELPSYDPNFNVVCDVWEDMFVDSAVKCECGAEKTGSPGHSVWCKKWSRV